jgi:fermentation-respiration switch protein FrsA (DUF1100 family)
MRELAAIHYPWLPVKWFMKNCYDCMSRIEQYGGPFFQSHGADDTIVPVQMARQLFDQAPGSAKKWTEFPGLGHNDYWPATYYDDLAEFLDALLPTGKDRRRK